MNKKQENVLAHMFVKLFLTKLAIHGLIRLGTKWSRRA